MSALLDLTLGFPAIAYTGDVPWHGAGFLCQPNETAKQWAERIGLTFNVGKYPTFWYNEAAGAFEQIPNRVTLVREDVYAPLSIVSNRYQYPQPSDVIDFFMDVTDKFGFTMETLGSLADGRWIWGMAKTPHGFSVKGDLINTYLLLATSYDGKFSTTGSFVTERVVCRNTLDIALSESGRAGRPVVRVPHIRTFDADEIKSALGLLDDSVGSFQSLAEQLASIEVTDRQAVEYFLELMSHPVDEDATEEELVEQVGRLYSVKQLLSCYQSAPGQGTDAADGTAWGLVNAVTFFTDHQRRAKDNGRRMASSWFGTGAKLKQKAVEQALKLAA